jgi:hypothetical protein
MNPAKGGIICFTEVLKKACFLKELRENKFNPKGHLSFAGISLKGSRPNRPLAVRS